MQPSVLCPTATELTEIAVMRTLGPPECLFDTIERSDRVRAAITNSGFSLPTGRLRSVMSASGAASDLPLALAVLLSDPTTVHLQRDGWLAFGGLGLDGRTHAIDEPLVNGIGPRPCVGRIWDPTDHIPEPWEDAVIALVEVENLQQAWDVITSFAAMEEAIYAPSN